ncbi:MAG: hypothetical protein D6679_11890 [Candidatus Hydrogenedentota bacterium]|nr:MAG: hypothetical protein D6679_11890 [Candidatus Hydrogenedentota bacterium]
MGTRGRGLGGQAFLGSPQRLEVDGRCVAGGGGNLCGEEVLSCDHRRIRIGFACGSFGRNHRRDGKEAAWRGGTGLVKIILEAYAAARDRLGFARREQETEAKTIAGLVGELEAEFPTARGILASSRYAVNSEYVEREAALQEGDEVAILPPVSGGLDWIESSVVVDDGEISLDEAFRAVAGAGAGAVVLFVGTVRDRNEGQEVETITYEAKRDMCRVVLREAIAEARERFEIEDAFIRHRLGRLEVAEMSVVIAVAAAHREAAYEANRFLLERLKEAAPIWKREARRIEGTIEEVWLGAGGG